MGMKILEKKDIKNEMIKEKDKEINGKIGWELMEEIVGNVEMEMVYKLEMSEDKMRYMKGNGKKK